MILGIGFPAIEGLAMSIPVNRSKDRQTVTECIFESGQLWGFVDPKHDGDGMPNGRLIDVIKFLQEKLAEIPAEFRENAVFMVEDESDGYGSSWATANITYERPETDEEIASRIEVASMQQKQEIDRDRALYERLKAKFRD